MATTIWNIDSAHSGIHFSVRHMVFAKVRGRFADWKGTVKIDPANVGSASAEVEINAASIDTNTADRDTHLRSADFLNVEKFPTIRFKSTRVEGAGSERFKLVGDLTIRGVTREVVLEAEFGGKAKDPWGNDRVAFTGTTSLKRADFGLTWNQALEAGGVLVGDRIDIEVEVQAVAAQESK